MSLSQTAAAPSPGHLLDTRYQDLPRYLFGLDDSGGESEMFAAGKPGWIVIGVQVNPADSTGNFSTLAEQGLGIIVRLSNGYGSDGTLPNSTGYDKFARQCAEFARQSRGARIWIIGDEPNAASQRPGNDGTTNSGEVITPGSYARCFSACREAIRSLRDHENDWVIPAAVAPFITHTNYPSNPTGDWVRYFADMLSQIAAKGGRLDALAIHAFTHGHDAQLVSSDARARGNLSTRHWNLFTYRDMLSAVPPALRTLPVFITKAGPIEPGWTAENRGWIQAAFAEIDAWNADRAHQPIQALCLWRWQATAADPAERSISDKAQVVEDFRAALQNEYRTRWPGAAPLPDILARWLVLPSMPTGVLGTGDLLRGRLVVANAGGRAWAADPVAPVRIAALWRNSAGEEISAPCSELPGDILPGQTAVLDDIKVSPPISAGRYSLRFDLLKEGQALGTPSEEKVIIVNPPLYAAEWLEPSDIGVPLQAGSVADIAVRIRNTGVQEWSKGGMHPVRLACRWFAEGETEAQPAQYVDLPEDVHVGQLASIEHLQLQVPDTEAVLKLRLELYEGKVPFGAHDVHPWEQTVSVERRAPDYAVEWVETPLIP